MTVNWRQHWNLARELNIKVRRIGRSPDSGEERRWNLLVQNILPVDSLEEWVPLDLFRIRLATSKSLLGITRQQLQKKKERENTLDI